MEFIEVSNVSFAYDEIDEDNSTPPKSVLNNVSLSIKKGEYLVILGHNGCGKSTLAKHLNGILLPSEGTVTIDGMNTVDEDKIFDIRKKVGLVFQNPDDQLVASIVEEDVAFGPENLGVKPEEIRLRVDNALKTVGMYEYKDYTAHKLSGGQKQRVAIAGILAMEPDCLVLDEPTAMLDPKGRQEVLQTIDKLNREKNITIVLITHFMSEAVRADRVVVMDKGKILLEGTPQKVLTQVELLKKHRLDASQATQLCHKLSSSGVKFDSLPLTTESCIEALDNVLKDKN